MKKMQATFIMPDGQLTFPLKSVESCKVIADLVKDTGEAQVVIPFSSVAAMERFPFILEMADLSEKAEVFTEYGWDMACAANYLDAGITKRFVEERLMELKPDNMVHVLLGTVPPVSTMVEAIDSGRWDLIDTDAFDDAVMHTPVPGVPCSVLNIPMPILIDAMHVVRMEPYELFRHSSQVHPYLTRAVIGSVVMSTRLQFGNNNALHSLKTALFVRQKMQLGDCRETYGRREMAELFGLTSTQIKLLPSVKTKSSYQYDKKVVILYVLELNNGSMDAIERVAQIKSEKAAKRADASRLSSQQRQDERTEHNKRRLTISKSRQRVVEQLEANFGLKNSWQNKAPNDMSRLVLQHEAKTNSSDEVWDENTYDDLLHMYSTRVIMQLTRTKQFDLLSELTLDWRFKLEIRKMK